MYSTPYKRYIGYSSYKLTFINSCWKLHDIVISDACICTGYAGTIDTPHIHINVTTMDTHYPDNVPENCMA